MLTHQGLEIGQNFLTGEAISDESGELQECLHYAKLCCNGGAVDQRTYQMIRMVDIKHPSWYDPMCNKFVLRPCETNPDKYYIEMPYGDTRPKLCSYNR